MMAFMTCELVIVPSRSLMFT